MKRFIEGEDRRPATLLPDCLEDYVSDDNPVRVIEAFIDELDLKSLGFEGVVPEATGRPSYHPAGAFERFIFTAIELHPVEPPAGAGDPAQHGTDVPDGPPDAGFQDHRRFPPRQRPGNWRGLHAVRHRCRRLNLFTQAIVAIDGSKFKAVNNRDKRRG